MSLEFEALLRRLALHSSSRLPKRRQGADSQLVISIAIIYMIADGAPACPELRILLCLCDTGMIGSVNLAAGRDLLIKLMSHERRGRIPL